MALDAGAEDFNSDEEEVFIITTTPEDFSEVREALEAEGLEFLEAAVKMIPDTYTEIDEEIVFTAVPDAVVNKYILTIATKKAAKDKLATIVDSEKIEDSEGELITNTNYIDEEDIESYYEKNQKIAENYPEI